MCHSERPSVGSRRFLPPLLLRSAGAGLPSTRTLSWIQILGAWAAGSGGSWTVVSAGAPPHLPGRWKSPGVPFAVAAGGGKQP